MKNKLACCYLTHEHPEVVDEILSFVCSEYGKKGIDIYIYDSSAGIETEEIVKRHAAKGLCGLFYVPIKFTTGKSGGNEKYLYVLSGYGLEGDYDYIWPVKDRCRYSGDTLDKICMAVDEDHDIVLTVDERDRYELITTCAKDVYTDPVEFFASYGALTTNWDCLIRRKDTMLDAMVPEHYAEDYGVGGDNNFNQTLTTFIRLAEMDKCSIRVIEAGLDDRHYSEKAQPLWTSDLMEVWIDRWIAAIFSLPSIYDGYKLSVIKTQLGHISLFGSNDSLVNMRDLGLFTPERLKSLPSMWNMISRLPYSNLERILAHDEKTLFDELYDEYLRSFADGDYEKGYYLFIQNGWMAGRIPKDKYRVLALSYYMYLKEIRQKGHSLLFEGVKSMDGLIEKFEKLGAATEQSQEDPKLFSVIIPCYNAADFVDRSLGSVMDQTLDKSLFEVFAVNDASTDDTLERLNGWAEKYPDTIKVITYEKNLRQGGARNLAMKEATGEYICFLDADDWMEPDALEIFASIINTERFDIIKADHTEDSEYNILHDVLRDGLVSVDTISRFGPEDMKELIEYDFGFVWESVYRRDIITVNGIWFPEHLAYEDVYWHRLIRFFAKNACVLDTVTHHHFNHEESTMNKKNASHHLDRLTCFEMLLEEYKKRGFIDRYYDSILKDTIETYYFNSYFMFFSRMDEIPDVYSRIRKTIYGYFPKWETDYDDSEIPMVLQYMLKLLKKAKSASPKDLQPFKEAFLEVT